MVLDFTIIIVQKSREENSIFSTYTAVVQKLDYGIRNVYVFSNCFFSFYFTSIFFSEVCWIFHPGT